MTQQHTDHPASASAAPLSVVLFDNDLFFSVKVTDTLKHAGYTTRTVRRLDDFTAALTAQRPVVTLVNTSARGLDWRAGITAARQVDIPVIAFGSHVDVETQQQARALGATSVIANSKLAGDLPGVVARALHRVPGRAPERAPEQTRAPSSAESAVSTGDTTPPDERGAGAANSAHATER